VDWTFPPDKAKDTREWCQRFSATPADPEIWRTLGVDFQARLKVNTCKPSGEELTGEGLVLTSLDKIDVAIMRWAVPGYIPQGEYMLIAGDGGEGKSLVTLHIAAKFTRGECCFGLQYDPLPPRSVILAACEDDVATTTKPRLWAAGADMKRVNMLDGIRLKDGSCAPFGLQHVKQIRVQLDTLKDCGLIIIDPVTAYLGASGIDDSNDAEIRTLLEPLRVVCRERGVVLQLVKHFNKGSSPKAKSRIAGAAGWRNAARAGFLVMAEPGETGNKCLIHEKLNGGPLQPSFLYRVVLPPPSEIQGILASLPEAWSPEDRRDFARQLARVEWLGITDWDGDSIAAEDLVHVQEEGPDCDRAAAWLRKYLSSGAQPGQLCTDQGNQAISIGRSSKWWRDRVLKGRCCGKSLHGKGFDSCWYFCLPGQQPPEEDAVQPPADQ